MHHNRLGADQLVNSSTVKNLMVLVDNKLAINQQYVPLQQKGQQAPG